MEYIKIDIVIMIHPDYQYTPKLVQSMVYMIANDVYPVCLASRILGKGALKGGMPIIKYIANRGLTLFQNILLNQKLSEYHTGYRAFSAEVLRAINYNIDSDDFIFDNEMLAQIFYKYIGQLVCNVQSPAAVACLYPFADNAVFAVDVLVVARVVFSRIRQSIKAPPRVIAVRPVVEIVPTEIR